MAIIKSVKQRLLETQRENKLLKIKANKQQDMLEFLGILNDVDITEFIDEEDADEGGITDV